MTSLCPVKSFQTNLLPSLGLLGLRVVVGSALVLHGMGKMQNPMGWMGDAPIPGIMQAFAALSEFGGGALLALGLLTPLAALGVAGTMLGAIFIAHVPAGDPFVSQGPGGSYELALVYFSVALLYLLGSPGKFSLDYLLLKRCKPDMLGSSGT